jgi:hypothetical protein
VEEHIFQNLAEEWLAIFRQTCLNVEPMLLPYHENKIDRVSTSALQKSGAPLHQQYKKIRSTASVHVLLVQVCVAYIFSVDRGKH